MGKGKNKRCPIQGQANVASSLGRWNVEAANGAGDKKTGVDGMPEATIRESPKATVLGGPVGDAVLMGLHVCGRAAGTGVASQYFAADG